MNKFKLYNIMVWLTFHDDHSKFNDYPSSHVDTK